MLTNKNRTVFFLWNDKNVQVTCIFTVIQEYVAIGRQENQIQDHRWVTKMKNNILLTLNHVFNYNIKRKVTYPHPLKLSSGFISQNELLPVSHKY